MSYHAIRGESSWNQALTIKVRDELRSTIMQETRQKNATKIHEYVK